MQQGSIFYKPFWPRQQKSCWRQMLHIIEGFVGMALSAWLEKTTSASKKGKGAAFMTVSSEQFFSTTKHMKYTKAFSCFSCILWLCASSAKPLRSTAVSDEQDG